MPRKKKFVIIYYALELCSKESHDAVKSWILFITWRLTRVARWWAIRVTMLEIAVLKLADPVLLHFYQAFSILLSESEDY